MKMRRHVLSVAVTKEQAESIKAQAGASGVSDFLYRVLVRAGVIAEPFAISTPVEISTPVQISTPVELSTPVEFSRPVDINTYVEPSEAAKLAEQYPFLRGPQSE